MTESTQPADLSKSAPAVDMSRTFSARVMALPDLPAVDRPGRDWTDAERAAFPMWARVCYAVRPFNSGCRMFDHWMQVFGSTDVWTCECGLEREGDGALVLRLLEALAEADALAEAARGLRAIVQRYRSETPLGHQPHMIASEADAALAAFDKAAGGAA